MERAVTVACKKAAGFGSGPKTGHQASGHANEGTRERSGEDAIGALFAPGGQYIAMGAIDLRSVLGAAIGAALYFALASFSLALSSFDSTLATVWLPSAGAVAFLLCVRLPNEVPFLIAAFVASFTANLIHGSGVDASFVFSIANFANVTSVIWLTRRSSGPRPDMSHLPTLASFVFAGGLVGPLLSACIAATGIGWLISAGGEAASWMAIWNGASAWFLTDSMGMVLIVPPILLIANLKGSWRERNISNLLERVALLVFSVVCVIMVFSQNAFPLLFLITPITLVHAFRLGSAGTALHVALVALVATAMTWWGLGPIVAASELHSVRLLLIQAFIAANFLTGLPISAILAGRNRLTEELTAGRRELKLLADNITDAVLQLDTTGVCTYASPSVREVLGREPDEFVGTRITERAHEDATDRIAEVLDKLLGGQSEKERLTYRRFLDDADGMPVFIEADCAIALDPMNGEKEGIVISARDITERVELELLLTRARRHAENAANAKSEFLANMSHEIRTPMNGVLGFAELMLQGELDSEQRRHTEMIVQSGRSMMLLLNDVLDLSKIEAGQINIDTGPIDLHATLEECVALHRLTATKKGLHIRLVQDDPTGRTGSAARRQTDLSPNIVTDGLRLRQIVLNLVGNAVKFTESGTVHVAYSVSDNALCVRVRDTGIGISAARLDTIFSPFTQGESVTARRYGGTGLGLSISRQLASLLGGVIDVESEPGVGSTFTLTLPTRVMPRAATGAEAKVETKAVVPASAVPEDLPPFARILLVEDHDVNRLLVTEMLKRCGQSVAIAHDGNEAISMVMDSMMRGHQYDLVLMDVQMPQCDGYAATRAIREEGIGPDTLPIIALTANAFPEDVAAARSAGMQGHLAKPIVFADLAKALQRWLPTRIVEAPMDRDIAAADPETDEETDGETGSEKANVLDLVPRASSTTEDAERDRGIAAQTTVATENTASAVAIPGAKVSRPGHSAALFNRWLTRRSETVEAVRDALAQGALTAEKNDKVAAAKQSDLIACIHKLAGTAATFGEQQLGDKASKLEMALRKQASAPIAERLAFELLALADEPASVPSKATSSQG
ncbi:MAG: ATP-binding protein [Erythrobacter sp.]